MKDFIKELNQKQIYVTLQDDDNLKISFNGKALDKTLLQELKAQKQELIAYLKQHQQEAVKSYQPIPKVATAESYELSSMQLRLWLLDQREDSAIGYGEQRTVHFKQQLHVPTFTKAIDAGIDRHEALRTVFKENADGQARQWILDREELNFQVDYQDLRLQENKEALVKSYIKKDKNKRFDLETGPLFRAALLQLEDEEYIFHFTMHHIISDGGSLDILSKDVFLIYEALQTNTSVPLKSLRIQYKDYAAWQLAALHSETFQEHKSYWSETLSGELPVINFPSNKERPTARVRDGHRLTTFINPTITQELKAFTKENGGSLFMSLLAVWNVLVYRYTAAQDIITGTVVSAREHADLSNQLGCYINTLALRNSVDPHERFIDFYQRLKSNTLTAYNYQMYPFNQIIEDLNLKGNLDRNFVFDVTLAYEGKNQKQFGSEISIETTHEIIDNGAKKVEFDIQLTFREVGDALRLIVIYNSSVYEKEMIVGLMQHYRQLLTNILVNPKQKILVLDYLLAAEKEHLLVGLNNTNLERYLDDKSLINLFLAQVNAHPDHVAVHYGGEELTYAALDERSNQLANYLQTCSITSGDFVGLLLDRSLDMVVGLLGILKAGAAYVPIDPSLPKERVSYMLQQSHTALVIASAAYTDCDLGNLPIVAIEDPTIWACSTAPVNVSLAANDVAYCIFTSGSSGKPKGVMMSHGSVLNLINGLAETVYSNYTANLRVALVASYAFDASVQQLFGSLLLGHSLYITEDETRKDGQALLHFYNEHQIAVSDGTPTHLRMVLHSLVGGEQLPYLKGWILAGEYLDKALVKQFYEGFGKAIDLYNFYGPTETCVDSTYFKINPAELEKYTTIPIGKPLPNERVYITDAHGNLLPKGATGELCIAGAGLGQGYIGDATLTAQRFVPNWVNGEERVYRTGDLAKWLPDGNLAYLGRIDDQVKLRGYRIELGEIASVLKEHVAVDDAVVLLNENSQSDPYLTAYIVPNKEYAYTVSQLLDVNDSKEQLKEKLYEMDNGVSMYFYNHAEAKTLYTEVFENKTYYKHGITVPKNATIIDVGANVGAFSVFSMITFDQPTIYAFEPVLPIYSLLEKNVSLYQGDIKLFNLGISNKEEEVVFDYYPNATTLSGKHIDNYSIHNDVVQFVKNMHITDATELNEQQLNNLLDESLVIEKQRCQLITLSRFIKEQHIDHIDLLKIDAENVELDVINGMTEDDWAKVDQAIIEVYDENGRLAVIRDKMQSYGFHVAAFQSEELTATRFYDVYCIKPSDRSEEVVQGGNANEKWYGFNTLSASLRASLLDVLPDYMVPTNIRLINQLPMTVNGKLDHKALYELVDTQEVEQEQPMNAEEEKMLAIWSEVLKLPPHQIGVTSDFSELGGHSLKMVFLVNKIKKEFEVKVPLKMVIQYSTIRSLCNYLLSLETEQYMAIPVAAPATHYPLSSAQKRMYFLNAYNKASTAYNVTQVVRIAGTLNLVKLNNAFQQLIARHESLRTIFYLKDGVPVQELIEVTDFKVSFLVENEDHTKLIRDFIKPFDLSKGPVFRIGIIPVTEEEHIMIIDNHHIISDMVTNEILLKDFMALYAGQQLAPLQLQYKDYAVWQQADQQLLLASQKEYWLGVFKEGVPTLNLLTSYPRPIVRSEKGNRFEIPLSAAKVEKLKKLANDKKLTAYSLFFAIYNILLSKLSNQEDLVVGTPVSGRTHTDLEGIAGLFVNTLAIRTYPKASLKISAFLQQVHEITIKALENQIYPYEELVDALNVSRDIARNPLFDVLFNYTLGTGKALLETTDFKLSSYGTPVTAAKFDLSFSVVENDGEMSLTFNYREDLYNEETIERLSTYLLSIIDQVLIDDSVTIGDIAIVSAEEQHLLLNTFNDTSVPISSKTLIDVFKEQAVKYAANTAVVFGNKTKTYKELDECSDLWAAHLINKGVCKGDTIGLMMERSIDMITAILAVMKSGAAYVPIALDQPWARAQHILDESNVSLVISNVTKIHEELLKAYTFINSNVLDIPLVAGVDYPQLLPEDMAYIIYTSGSTGTPKGVITQHKNVINFVAHETRFLAVETSDRILQLSPYHFDASVQQIWLALTTGAQLVLIQEKLLGQPKEFINYIDDYQISLLSGTPSFLEGLSLSGLKYLKKVCAFGEACNPRLAAKYVNEYQFYNEYGPTETTVISVACEITQEMSERKQLPIGKPVSNAQAYILDDALQLLPLGCVGQLYLAGTGIAQGYLNRPALTKARFIANPYGNGYMYQTGDLAKWNQDGTIDYLGRADEQVKLNGVRIELGEITYHLNSLPEITNSAVVVHEIEGIKYLTAYYITSEALTKDKVRGHLLDVLPMSMIPSYYIELTQFPTTPSGKLARKLLPLPSVVEMLIPPSNETEKHLVTIWAELLKCEANQLGVTTDFFEVGGHSLNGMQLVDTINKHFGVDLKLLELFKRRTIRELGELIDMNLWLEQDTEANFSKAGKETLI